MKKNAIETFILNNDSIDEEHIEIICLYLESIKIDDDYKNKIINMMNNT